MESLPTHTGVDDFAPLGAVLATNQLSSDGNDGKPVETSFMGGDSGQKVSKPRALVVDDAPDVTEMIAMLLRHAGYDVVTVFSAPDAFDTARAEQFDVVVSDIGMPGMNGYELAEALRALPAYTSVPMSAVTGFAMYDDRERALESGFNAFMTKPINPMDLIDLVKRLQV